MKKHTSLINEIEGNYTKRDFWADAVIIGALVVMVLAVGVVVFEVVAGDSINAALHDQN